MNSTPWFRRNTWYFKGKREYTKSAFETANARFGENELDVECSDRHFMITGATSKIGLATALEIAKRGGILHLVCRNVTSMKEARSHIITTTGNDRIYQHQVNLADPQEVATWAEEHLKSFNSLDVIIHNASCMALHRDEETNEKLLETNFATNVLAVHIITTTLLPLLKKSSEPRVITVTNAGMLTVKLDPRDINFEEMNPFDGRLAYLYTKRQQVVMNFCNAQRFERIKFFSVHPGWVDTPVTKSLLQGSYETMKNFLRTPYQGADTIIWLAISHEALKHSSGLFFQDRAPVPTHLPLAWTRSSAADEERFMSLLDEHLYRFINPELFEKGIELTNDLQGGGDHKRSSENLLTEQNVSQHPIPATSTGESGQQKQELPPTETEEKMENYHTQEELRLRVDKIANVIETIDRHIEEKHSQQDQLNESFDVEKDKTCRENGDCLESKNRHNLNSIEEESDQSRDFTQFDSASQGNFVPNTSAQLGPSLQEHVIRVNSTQLDPTLQEQVFISNNVARLDPTSQEQIVISNNAAQLDPTLQEQVVITNEANLDPTSQEQVVESNTAAQLDPTSQEQVVESNTAAQLDIISQEQVDISKIAAQLDPTSQEQVDVSKNPEQLDPTSQDQAVSSDNSAYTNVTEETGIKDKDSTKILNLDEGNKEEDSVSCTRRQ